MLIFNRLYKFDIKDTEGRTNFLKKGVGGGGGVGFNSRCQHLTQK